MRSWVIFALGVLISTNLAFAQRTELCFENYECSAEKILQAPMRGILEPFEVVIPGFSLLVVWGPIVMAIWILSKDALLTGIFGMIISGTMTGLNPDAVAVGVTLFAASLGFAFFTIWPRLKNIT
ncbi:MAG: hypothetical protein ABI337_01630 [Nitrososphaera sp.]|jgi:hypothetical protein